MPGHYGMMNGKSKKMEVLRRQPIKKKKKENA
jgi:hypothetical protein